MRETSEYEVPCAKCGHVNHSHSRTLRCTKCDVLIEVIWPIDPKEIPVHAQHN